MLIRTMQELESQGRVVSISQGKSTAVRLLTKADGLNFSISEARAQKARQAELWYKNHWEANYVRAGHATLEDRTTGQRWTLEPGVLYCVGPKDKHRIIRDDARLRIISVFNPPLGGNETHRRGRRLSADGPDSTGAGAHVRRDPGGRAQGRARGGNRGLRDVGAVPNHRRRSRLLLPLGAHQEGRRG